VANDAIVLYNLALDLIGARNKISSPLEQSREAEACNLWFPQIRDQVLASAAWPEATKQERLAQLAIHDNVDNVWLQGDPRPDYLTAYALPTDCLRPQFISGGGRFTIQAYGLENRALMTNNTSPILVYTFRHPTVSMWSQGLQMAIMYGLASMICTPLTGKTSRAKLLIENANNHILAARETAANMNNERFESLPDWITARGFTDGGSTIRYMYPYGGLLSVSNAS